MDPQPDVTPFFGAGAPITVVLTNSYNVLSNEDLRQKNERQRYVPTRPKNNLHCSHCGNRGYSLRTLERHEMICFSNPVNKGKRRGEIRQSYKEYVASLRAAGRGGPNNVVMEASRSATNSGSPSVVQTIQNLTNRMTVLEKHWIGFFGSLKREDELNQPNSDEIPASEQQPIPPTVKAGELLKPEDLDDISEDELISDDAEDEDNDTEPGPSQPKLTAEEKKARNKLKRQRSKMNIGNRPKMYPCCWCSETFRKLRGLKQHVREKHKMNEIFGCSNCQILFPTKKKQLEHDSANHRFPCDFCPGWRIRIQRKRDHHVENVHGLKSMTCHVCFVTLKCFADVIPHLKQHESETGQRYIFQCEKCIKPHFFYTVEDMNRHMAINFHRKFGAAKDFS